MRTGRKQVASRAVATLTALLVVFATGIDAQESPSVTGRVSVFVDTSRRVPVDGVAMSTVELWDAATFETPYGQKGNGVEFRFDGRYSRSLVGTRPVRASVYDAYVGGRVGTTLQLRVRAGHMWLQDLGTVGALAGGLVEVGTSAAEPGGVDRTRVRVGAFAGREPLNYEAGYAPNVQKWGGYAAVERGFLRRHVVGYTRVRQAGLTERSVLTVNNLIPAGQRLFIYQAAEFEVQGPAAGTAARGLSYFLVNARVNPASRVELTGTYNRGRALDARTLTSDLLSGRVLSSQAVEGLIYESRGGRVSVEAARGARVFGSYTQDRNNRDDALTGRVTVGGHVSNVGGSGLDVTASTARVNRSTGAYHSTYFSVGRSAGRAVYLSGDYTTSLSVVRFLRGDGIVIETRPWTKRWSGSVNANVGRRMSFSVTGDVTDDATQREFRALTGLSYRIN